MPGLSGNKPSSMRARPGGGFNMGGGFNEHLDESAMAQASQQKQLTQAQADPATAQAAAQKAQSQAQAQKPPPEVGSLTDELIKRPAKGVWEEIKKFFSLNTWLGIEPPQIKTPEEQAKARQIHQRYQQLDREQQEVAQKRYQELMQKKKAEEEEKMRKKQMEEQKKAQELPMPSSPQKGPAGPGASKKQKAQARLQQQMKTMGTVAGAD